MGWEYHNRERDERGRWARSGKNDRLQVRCTDKQYEQIRGRAYARQQSISEYVLELIQLDMLRAFLIEHPPTVKTLCASGSPSEAVEAPVSVPDTLDDAGVEP